eukprot:CAMPEP_0194340028 /NCGR_PEP_ID=MMETSP0171-20130528/85118_1 /TAXON_ID=218684 /ORGANISM="Corethron pennatum, Strain L29A3" /LENGTH=100 /DNA_ID=CAMNT_0039104827 /DNA_START=75 /DNA_END=373 /DNA_ORIENTATION=+
MALRLPLPPLLSVLLLLSCARADIPRSSPRHPAGHPPPLPVPSPSLLPSHFLRHTYRVAPGEWEGGEGGRALGGRHGTNSRAMRAFLDGSRRMMVRQVPG